MFEDRPVWPARSSKGAHDLPMVFGPSTEGLAANYALSQPPSWPVIPASSVLAAAVLVFSICPPSPL